MKAPRNLAHTTAKLTCDRRSLRINLAGRTSGEAAEDQGGEAGGGAGEEEALTRVWPGGGALGVAHQPIFEFDVGANSVSGQASFRAGQNIPVAQWFFDPDDRYFLLPPGTMISTIELSWVTYLGPGTAVFTAGVNLLAGTWDHRDGLTFHTVEYDFMSNRSGVQSFVEAQIEGPHEDQESGTTV